MLDVNCNQVTVHGTGWEPTEASVELASPRPSRRRPVDYLIIEQVFPDENVINTTIPVPDKPGGRFIVQVLIDGQPMDPRTEPFTIPRCSELPFAGHRLYRPAPARGDRPGPDRHGRRAREEAPWLARPTRFSTPRRAGRPARSTSASRVCGRP